MGLLSSAGSTESARRRPANETIRAKLIVSREVIASVHGDPIYRG